MVYFRDLSEIPEEIASDPPIPSASLVSKKPPRQIPVMIPENPRGIIEKEKTKMTTEVKSFRMTRSASRRKDSKSTSKIASAKIFTSPETNLDSPSTDERVERFERFAKELQLEIEELVKDKNDLKEKLQEEKRKEAALQKRAAEEKEREQRERERMEEERKKAEQREKEQIERERKRQEEAAREEKERQRKEREIAEREERKRIEEKDRRAREQREAEELAKKQREAEEAARKERELREKEEERQKMKEEEEQARELALAHMKKREEDKSKGGAEGAARDRAAERITGSTLAIAAAEGAVKYVEKLELDTTAFLKEPAEQVKVYRIRTKAELSKRVNQISCNGEQVTIVSNHLIKILEGATQSVMAYNYLENLLAKRIIEKAANEVKSASQYPALYLAAIVLSINRKFPTFLRALMGNMTISCPYVVPRLFLQNEQEDIDAYKRRLGYVANPDGHLEDEEKYTERMCSIVGLYAAIIRVPVRAGHPVPIDHAWSWLARILNMMPFNIAPDLIITFLKFTSKPLQEAYKNQFFKLIHYLEKIYLPELPANVKSKASRLEILISDFKKTRGFNLEVFEADSTLFNQGLIELRSVVN